MGGGSLHVDTFAHTTSGIAYQDKSQQPETIAYYAFCRLVMCRQLLGSKQPQAFLRRFWSPWFGCLQFADCAACLCWSGAILTAAWSANAGVMARGVNWQRFTQQQLLEICDCVGGLGLAAVLRLMAEDHAGAAGEAQLPWQDGVGTVVPVLWHWSTVQAW
jgi:hypothetical protein